MTTFTWRVLELVKIVDGDTVDLRIDRGFYDETTVRFRLKDVNTAELNSVDESERAEARDAKAFAKDWFALHHGPTHGLQVTSFKAGVLADGGFGRWLGAVSCECGAGLERDLVLSGNADLSLS